MVALFTRAWIEIIAVSDRAFFIGVALFTRAWIEMQVRDAESKKVEVALFTRAWIEMGNFSRIFGTAWSPSSRGRGLK